MSNRNVEQISWGEAARRGAKDFVWDVLPKSVLSSFVAESLNTIKNALGFNFSDLELRGSVPLIIAGGNFWLRGRFKTVEVAEDGKVKKIKVDKYDYTRPPIPRGLRTDFDFDEAKQIIIHSPKGLAISNLKHIMRVTDTQAVGLLEMRRNEQAREATGVFESSKIAMVTLNTVVMPAILNSPLPWEHKVLLIGGLAAAEVGFFALQRKWGILPETTAPPTSSA